MERRVPFSIFKKLREYDSECERKRGISYEFDRNNMSRSTEFDVKKCVEQKIPPKKLNNNRYFPKVRTKYQCDKINGIWDESHVSREDPSYKNFYKGVCWKTKDDAQCADHSSECIIRNDTRPFCISEIAKSVRSCHKDPKCKWVTDSSGNEDCYSKLSGNVDKNVDLPLDFPLDVTDPNFQLYLYEYYNGELPWMPPYVQPLISKEKNRCNMNQKGFTLSTAQSIVNMTMRGISRKESPNRGLLCVHSLGSGKTITAAGVIEAFWDTDRDIVICSSKEGLSNNPPKRFHEACARFFPSFGKDIEEWKDMTDADKIKSVATRFGERKVHFKTFAQLSHYILVSKPLKAVIKAGGEIERKHRMFLNNAILIIDEVHNIFNPLPTQKEEHFALKNALLKDSEFNKNLKLCVLTATPGDCPDDIVQLLNMVRSRNSPEIKIPNTSDLDSMKLFKKQIHGLVSYFNMTSDTSKFPVVIENEPYRLPMSEVQYKKYSEQFNPTNLKNSHTDYDALEKLNQLEKFYKPQRRYSNMLYNLPTTSSTSTAANGSGQIFEFSSKIPKLLDVLKDHPNEKHYLYSAFFENRGHGGHGVLSIAKFLESEMGYTQMTAGEAMNFKANDDGTFNNFPTKGKRYILVIPNALAYKKMESGDVLSHLLKIYNSPENSSGEYIHTILASNKFNEGMDLKAVRHVHILEPLVTLAMEQQAIGRAQRQCSHSQLDPNNGEWTVQVHRYISENPSSPSPSPSASEDKENRIYNEILQSAKKLEDGKQFLKKYSGNNASKKVEEVKKIIKKDEKKLKQKMKHDIKLIDDHVSSIAREKMSHILKIQNALKDSAIDCNTLYPFHKNDPNQKITCTQQPNLGPPHLANKYNKTSARLNNIRRKK